MENKTNIIITTLTIIIIILSTLCVLFATNIIDLQKEKEKWRTHWERYMGSGRFRTLYDAARRGQPHRRHLWVVQSQTHVHG